ncbi:MAG: chemotaxis protein CheD [Hyphomicrobiales bacterium]
MTHPAIEQRRLSVGIGQLAISRDPREVLVAYGLGSCVGVTAYDPEAHVGGLAHILLPSGGGRAANANEPGRFADLAIDELLRRLEEAGADRRRLVVKIAGGASVLGAANAEKFKIGARNAEAIRERLKFHGLSPAAEDIGGEKGRTLELHGASGRTFVRTVAAPAQEL